MISDWGRYWAPSYPRPRQRPICNHQLGANQAFVWWTQVKLLIAYPAKARNKFSYWKLPMLCDCASCVLEICGFPDENECAFAWNQKWVQFKCHLLAKHGMIGLYRRSSSFEFYCSSKSLLSAARKEGCGAHWLADSGKTAGELQSISSSNIWPCKIFQIYLWLGLIRHKKCYPRWIFCIFLTVDEI